jgi:hypothetical protein
MKPTTPARPIKDYPLNVRKLARQLTKERWDQQSQQSPDQTPGSILELPQHVRKLARELTRQKLDKKFPPNSSG